MNIRFNALALFYTLISIPPPLQISVRAGVVRSSAVLFDCPISLVLLLGERKSWAGESKHCHAQHAGEMIVRTRANKKRKIVYMALSLSISLFDAHTFADAVCSRVAQLLRAGGHTAREIESLYTHVVWVRKKSEPQFPNVKCIMCVCKYLPHSIAILLGSHNKHKQSQTHRMLMIIMMLSTILLNANWLQTYSETTGSEA